MLGSLCFRYVVNKSLHQGTSFITILDWVKDFLHGRQQQVGVGSSMSSWTHITSGVPQESVLGLVLFFIFVNDILSLL